MRWHIPSSFTIILAIGTLLSLQGNGSAQPIEETATNVSLEELLEVATRHSPELARAYFTSESAKGLSTSTLAAESWQLGANLGASLGSSPAPIASDANRELKAIRTGIDISKLLPTGGVLTLALQTQTQSDSSLTTSIAGSNAGIQFVQPLSRFRGQSAQQQQIAQANISEKIAFYQLESAANVEVLRIVDGYRRLALAEEILEIRNQSVELALHQLEIATAAVRSGVAAASEKSTVEQARYSREADVVAAEIEIMERSLALRELVGMPIGPDDVLLQSDGLETRRPQKSSLNQTLGKVLRGNPQLKIAELGVSLGKESVRGAEQLHRPQVDLSLSLATVGQGADLSSSLSALAGGQGYEVAAGLRMQWDLGGRLGKGSLKSARSQNRNAEVAFIAARRSANADAIRAWSQLRGARTQLKVGEKALEFAQNNVKLAERRFRAGDIGSFEVLLRHDELARSKIVALVARLALLNASDRLAATTGELLDNYDIAIDAEIGAI